MGLISLRPAIHPSGWNCCSRPVISTGTGGQYSRRHAERLSSLCAAGWMKSRSNTVGKASPYWSWVCVSSRWDWRVMWADGLILLCGGWCEVAWLSHGATYLWTHMHTHAPPHTHTHPHTPYTPKQPPTTPKVALSKIYCIPVYLFLSSLLLLFELFHPWLTAGLLFWVDSYATVCEK